MKKIIFLLILGVAIGICLANLPLAKYFFRLDEKIEGRDIECEVIFKDMKEVSKFLGKAGVKAKQKKESVEDFIGKIRWLIRGTLENEDVSSDEVDLTLARDELTKEELRSILADEKKGILRMGLIVKEKIEDLSAAAKTKFSELERVDYLRGKYITIVSFENIETDKNYIHLRVSSELWYIPLWPVKGAFRKMFWKLTWPYSQPIRITRNYFWPLENSYEEMRDKKIWTFKKGKLVEEFLLREDIVPSDDFYTNVDLYPFSVGSDFEFFMACDIGHDIANLIGGHQEYLCLTR